MTTKDFIVQMVMNAAPAMKIAHPLSKEHIYAEEALELAEQCAKVLHRNGYLDDEDY